MDTLRLLIRRFRPDDWSELYEYLSQEETVKYEPYDVITEPMSKQEALRRSKSESFWAVCLKSTGKLIGNIYMSEQAYHTWELGYVFNSKYLGQGYATEAARAMINYMFAQGAHRITAECNPLNERSWKLLERLGMSREGVLRQNVFFSTDERGEPVWQDTYVYAMLRSEWK